MQGRHIIGTVEILYGNDVQTAYPVRNTLRDPDPVVRIYTNTTPRLEVIDVTVSYPSEHQIEITFRKPPGQHIYHVHIMSR